MYVFSKYVFHRQILNVCHGMYFEYETREKGFLISSIGLLLLLLSLPFNICTLSILFYFVEQ